MINRLKITSPTLLAVLTTVAIFCFVVICNMELEASQSSSMQMRFEVGSTLRAWRLYDVTASRLVRCSAACLADNTCIMVTFSQQTHQCSLFTTGSALYNLTGFQVYIMQSRLYGVSQSVNVQIIPYTIVKFIGN